MKSYNNTLKSGEGLYYNETVNNSPSLKNESNKLNCSECDKCFSSRQLLDAHKKLVHEKIRDHKCNSYEKSFPHPGNLDTY